MYEYGIKTANSIRNTAAVVLANLTSARALRSMDAPAFLFEGNRFRRRQHARTPAPMLIRAITRMAQVKPILGARYRMTRGNTIPPIPPAVHASPVAKARRLQNQCPIAARLGLKRRDAEIPPRTPNESRN